MCCTNYQKAQTIPHLHLKAFSGSCTNKAKQSQSQGDLVLSRKVHCNCSRQSVSIQYLCGKVIQLVSVALQCFPLRNKAERNVERVNNFAPSVISVFCLLYPCDMGDNPFPISENVFSGEPNFTLRCFDSEALLSEMAFHMRNMQRGSFCDQYIVHRICKIKLICVLPED